MAVWYEMKRDKKGFKDFLNCNWGFHDFRPERVEYIPGKDMVEIFLKYDSNTEGILLRFIWIHDLYVNTKRDYDAEWMSGSQIVKTDKDTLIWIDTDDGDANDSNKREEMKKYTTYVEFERLVWAVTDAKGNPIELPANRIDQVWHIWDKVEKKHFELEEFTGDWSKILKPWYNR